MHAKIKIQIDYTSLLIPIILVSEGNFSDAAALLLAATIHECGHLLAARLLKIPVLSLHISVLGAQLRLCDPFLSYKREWLLCAAGPLTSGLLAFFMSMIGLFFPIFFSKLAQISLVLGIVNLLPIGWLDGGRMLRATCYQILSPTCARAIVRAISFLCFLTLWMTSVYLILRTGRSLSLFVFSFSLFVRFFLSKAE